jgi:hypothetical protein
MTFRKNLFVMLSAVVLVVIGALLMDIRMPQIVDGLTLVIPTVAMALLIEDLWRKILTAREKLTWQYFLGEVFVVGSGLAWLWASTSTDMKSMGIRLGVVFFLGLLGGIWFALCYHPSVQSPEEREQEKWARFRAKIKKADKADAFKTLAGVLRFRLLGDDLSGDLDFDRPLAVYHEELLTYEEAMAAEPDGNGNLPPIQGSAHDYLQMLVRNLPE